MEAKAAYIREMKERMKTQQAMLEGYELEINSKMKNEQALTDENLRLSRDLKHIMKEHEVVKEDSEFHELRYRSLYNLNPDCWKEEWDSSQKKKNPKYKRFGTI